MQLTLTQSIRSPFGRQPSIIWLLENEGAFLISDSWDMARVDANGQVNILWQTTDKEAAYQLASVYDDRVSEPSYDGIRQAGISGFQLPGMDDYRRIYEGNKYHPNFRPLLLRAHGSALLYLEEKGITLLKLTDQGAIELSTAKVKGKGKTAEMLHPVENLIVYGTNYGELYGQPFHAEGFEKVFKIDQLPNVCYQLAFSENGERMFVVGLGFLKIYHFGQSKFKEAFSLATAARSFELINDYLILNKGMHGIDIIHVGERPQRVSSLDLPFAADRMVYLASERTFLATAASSEDLYLLKWSE